MSDWLDKYRSQNEFLKNISPELSSEVAQYTNGICDAINWLINSKKIWSLSSKKTTALSSTFDTLFNRIRKEIRWLLWKITPDNLTIWDLKLFRRILRLPENFELETLRKILKWELDEEKIPYIINGISSVDKQDCEDYLLSKIWIPNDLKELIYRLIEWKIDLSDIKELSKNLINISNDKLVKFLFEKIISSKIIDIEVIIILFSEKSFRKYSMWYLADDHRWKQESHIRIIHTLKDSIWDLGSILWILSENKKDENYNFRRIVLNALINDETIEAYKKADIIKKLWLYIDIAFEILWIDDKDSIDIIKKVIKEDNNSITPIERYVSLVHCISSKWKEILFYILFKDFSIDTLKEIIKSWQDNSWWNNEAKANLRNRVCSNFEKLLWIPKTNPFVVFKSVPSASNIAQKVASRIKWEGEKSEIKQLSIKSDNLLVQLLQIINTEWTIAKESERDVVEKVYNALIQTKTYEWRKLIYELYFKQIRWVWLEYNWFIDLLLQNWYIKKSEVLKDKKFQNFIDTFFSNPNNIIWQNEIIEKMKLIIENCSFWWFFSIWFSDFIINLLTKYNKKEIKEIIGDLMIDWEIPIDMVWFARIEWWIKKRKYDLENKKTKKENDEQNKEKPLKDFYSIDYDIWSLKIVFDFFWIEFSEENYKRMKKTLDFLKIKKRVKEKDWTIKEINEWKDFSKIRKNLKTLFAMFPLLTIEEFQRWDVFEILSTFDNEMFEFLRIENLFFAHWKIDNDMRKKMEQIHKRVDIELRWQLQSADAGQKDRLNNRLREFEEVSRNMKFNITLEWLIKNKNNPFLTLPWKIDSLIIASFRHILSWILRWHKWNKYYDLKSRMTWVDWSSDFRIFDWTDLVIWDEDLLNLWAHQSFVADLNYSLHDLVWKFIYNNTIFE